MRRRWCCGVVVGDLQSFVIGFLLVDEQERSLSATYIIFFGIVQSRQKCVVEVDAEAKKFTGEVVDTAIVDFIVLIHELVFDCVRFDVANHE